MSSFKPTIGLIAAAAALIGQAGAQGLTPCTSTPDISFGSIIDWGCPNPGYCQIDVPVTANANPTGSGTYDVVVNASGTPGSGFVGTPGGSEQQTTSSNRGKVKTQNLTKVTVYLLHGINQMGGVNSDMNSLRNTLISTGGLDPARYALNSGFNFAECARVTSCTVSQYGDICGIDAGGRSLARYILANPPPGNIVLIGYSMGGLVARDMIANNYLANGLPAVFVNGVMTAPAVAGLAGGGKVIGLITLGTPHPGYPYDSLDDSMRCYLIDQDLAGGWEPLLPTPLELPPLPMNGSTPTFFDRLRQSWGGTSLAYWLAAAGTVYTNSTRIVPPRGLASNGCISPRAITDQPYSDGVVCRDSALYQEPTGFFGWAVPPFPTETPWQDPQHQYVHMKVPLFYGALNGTLFGVTNTGTLYELYNPPFPGNLVTTILSTLNAH